MTDTPLTDEQLVDRIHLSPIVVDCVPADFARKLEKRLAAANAAAGRLHADLYGMQDGALLRDLQSDNKRLAARLRAAVAVLDAITNPDGELRIPASPKAMRRLEAAFSAARKVA